MTNKLRQIAEKYCISGSDEDLEGFANHCASIILKQGMDNIGNKIIDITSKPTYKSDEGYIREQLENELRDLYLSLIG